MIHFFKNILLFIVILSINIIGTEASENINSYECYIGEYTSIDNLQYYGSGGFAFIGTQDYFYSNPEYILIKDGKEIGKYGELIGLQISPDGSSWAAIGRFLDDTDGWYLIKDGKKIIQYDASLVDNWGIDGNYYNRGSSDRTLVNTPKFRYSLDSKHFAYIDGDSYAEYVVLDGKKLIGEKIRTGKTGIGYNYNEGSKKDITLYEYKMPGVFADISRLYFSENNKDIWYQGDGEVFEFYDKDNNKGFYIDPDYMKVKQVLYNENNYFCMKNGILSHLEKNFCNYKDPKIAYNKAYELSINSYSGIVNEGFFSTSIVEKAKSPLICKAHITEGILKYWNISLLMIKGSIFYLIGFSLLAIYLVALVLSLFKIKYFLELRSNINIGIILLFLYILCLISIKLLEIVQLLFVNTLKSLFEYLFFYKVIWYFLLVILIGYIAYFIFKGKKSSINGSIVNKNTITPQDQIALDHKKQQDQIALDHKKQQEQIALEHKKQLEAKYKYEQEEKRKQEIHNRRNKLIPERYINSFLNLAERKFHKRDKYGNLDKSALDKEIIEYLEMIAKQQGHTDQLRAIDALSRGNSYPRLNDDYTWLKSYLKQISEKHISDKEKKSQQSGIDIDGMSGIEFERYLAKIFENAGYVINYTPESGDQGADLVASKGNKRLVVQAKRYKASVGNGAVQEVIGAIRFYNGTEGWVITNSVFTSSARELARINNIRLIDGSELMKLRNLI